ncbi:accessory gene regulator B family protein [Proteiniborus sp. MB09-C3]|uniref:accessory gene regulator ArgB-like protein n=1 Tax=Proteiniborus sp. MB09-C3 TaxID=3050072 RepID=UPI002553E54C|nr:accessory gene regulator B family protein [Proteiniborus sp. MB09-C3]WIV11590.1 accessory gene regulator B family protein [Proteiniborus sp. MB09-C3]
MINQMACYIFKKMKDNNAIDEENMDMYVFGIEILLITIIKYLGLFIISLLLGVVKEAIAFTLAFSMLRIQAGGVHLESFWQCFVITNIITFSFIFLSKALPISHTPLYSVIMLIISAILVLAFAPVDTENKRLNELEKKLYKKRSIYVIIIGSLITISLGLIYKSFITYGNIVSLGFLCEGITLTPLIARKKSYEEVN